MGSATISSVPICSMMILLSLTFSRTTKYFISMCLLRLPLLLFLAKNTAAALSQRSFIGLGTVSITLSPEEKFFNHNACFVAS